jgi:hypothetical protein
VDPLLEDAKALINLPDMRNSTEVKAEAFDADIHVLGK